MPERNASIAAILDEIADLLDIQGANPFRVRAYRNAARGIGDLGTEVDVLMERGTPLTDIPGIGADLAKKVVEILQTGTCEFLERLHQELPREITELLKIPALGPRRVKTLYQDLRIENLEQLLEAAKAGHIRSLPGFGEKTEQRLLDAAQGRIAKARRFPLVAAAGYAEPLANYLREAQDVSRVEIAGSYRRMRSTVGDIDVVAIGGEGASIMDRLVNYPEVARVLSSSAPAVLKAIEVGIGPDGILSVPDSLLSKFDMVVVAVHTDLDLQREQQTRRIVKALQHLRVAMLAQPLQSDRAQRFDVDFAAVVHQAKERDVALLVTLHPRRIAIPDIYLEVAKREGARVVIASEAGSAEDLAVLRFSVGFAGPVPVWRHPISLNTSSVDVLLKWLHTRATRMSEH